MDKFFTFLTSGFAMKFIEHFSLETTGLSKLSGPCHRIADAKVELANCASRNSSTAETHWQRESGKFNCDCGKREL